MNRDAAFARWVSRETARLGLELLTVDGRRTIDQNAEAVEHIFDCHELAV
jgi:hypothetical protein